MSESGDYDPGVWKGYNFTDARKAYDVHLGRSYDDAKAAKVDLPDLVPPTIETDSDYPVAIVCDGTGSMGKWPAVMFSKLPYMELEGKEYLGPNMKISFSVIGDVYTDKYPLQVRPFVDGKDLATNLTSLVIEKNGGSNYCESYDLAAVYYLRNVEMPNAVANTPIMIFIGDEGLYDFVDKKGTEKWARTEIDGRLSVQQLFLELKKKFSVYLVRKPYGSGYKGVGDKVNPIDEKMHRQWTELLGADHVVMLPTADRVVDVIFGIFARETGRIGYFKKELQERQRPDQVETVMKSLETIHKIPHKARKQLPGPAGASVTRGSGGNDSKNSVSLLD